MLNQRVCPKSLALLIIVAYLATGILYAVNTPPWEAPDEPAHYNYIRYLAENHRFPVLQMGDYPHNYLEEIKDKRFPPEMSIEPLRYEFHQPPLYYVLAAVVYKLFAGRLLPLRLLSVLLGCCLLWVAYHVAKEIFPRDEALALGTTAFVAFVPMHIAMTAAVNNDTLAELILAVILWMLVRYVREGVEGKETGFLESFVPKTRATASTCAPPESAVERKNPVSLLVGLGVLMGLGLLTKINTLVAIPLALVAVLVREDWLEQSGKAPPPTRGRPVLSETEGLGRGGFCATEGPPSPGLSLPGRGKAFRPAATPAERLRRSLLSASCILLPALLLALPWFVRNALAYGGLDIWGLGRHDAIVIDQPRTAEWLAQLGATGLAKAFILTTFKSFWAQFGWMGILVDQRIYLILALLCAIVGLGLVLFVIRNVRQRTLSPSQRMALGLLALSASFTVISYLWYNSKFVQHQGRYLFPALVPIGLAFALGLREILGRENAKMAVFLLLAGIVILAAKGWVTRDFNKLSIFLLGGVAAALGIKALLSEKYDDWVFALPYLGLSALDLICLFKVIVPYFES